MHTAINYTRTLLFANEQEMFAEMLLTLSGKFLAADLHHYEQLRIMHALYEISHEALDLDEFLKVEKSVMKNFIEQHHLELILSYGPLIAKVYEEGKQYKRASELYQLLYKTSEKLRLHNHGKTP